MAQKQARLIPGYYFHIYNRGNNSQRVFHCEADYERFLFLWERFIDPVAATLAYKLLPNHFHAVVRVREVGQYSQVTAPIVITESIAAQAVSKFFISFAKSMHRASGTNGAVFKRPCQRKLIDSDSYLQEVIGYVLLNPYRHGLVTDYGNYAYSSISVLRNENSFVNSAALLEIFGGREALSAFLEAARTRPHQDL